MQTTQSIDGTAARNRPGATLNVPGPTFAITRRNRDGTIDELVDGEWVSIRDGTRTPFS